MKRIGGDSAALGVLIALITAGLAVIFWPMLREPGEMLFFGFGDCWTYYGPTSFFVDRSIHAGVFPLWNPLIFAGQPIAGNPQYLLFYPPNLLRSLLTLDPTPWRTHVGMAILQYLHVLIAGAGTFALARSLALGRIASVTAALAFTFSAALTHRIYGHLYMIYVAAWWPWALFCLHRMLDADSPRSRLRWTLALAIAYALAILGGAPQLTYVIGISLALYWMLIRAQDAWALRRTPVEGRMYLWRVGIDLACGAAAVALAVALSTALLGPAYQLALHTSRIAAAGEDFEPISGDRGWNLLERLAVYTGGYNYEGFKTLSASGLILVFAGVFAPRRREPLALAGLAFVLVVGSVEHSPLHAAIVALSPFPYGAAGRAMIVAALPLALLAGLGIDRVRAGTIAGTWRVAASAGLVVLGLVFCATIWQRLDDGYPGVSYEALLFPAMTAGLAAASLWSLRARRFAAVFPLIVFAEAADWRGAAIRRLTEHRAMFASISNTVAHGRPPFWQGNSRGTSTLPNTPFYRLDAEINGYDPLYLEGVSKLVYPRANLGVFARGADAYSMASTTKLSYLLFKRSFWLHRQYVLGELSGDSQGFPPATTAYLAGVDRLSVPRIDPGDLAHMPYSEDVERLVVSDRAKTFTPQSHPTADAPLVWASNVAVPPQHKTLALYIRSDVRTILSIVTSEKSEEAENRVVAGFEVPSTQDQVQRFDVPMPDLESMILGLVVSFPEASEAPGSAGTPNSLTLERVELIVDRSDESKHFANLRRSANTTDVEVRELPGPRILSHIDFAYPGWHAYVDGAEVPILRAFSYFKAVEVPAGTHRIRFAFRPASTYLAMAVSAIAWITCLTLLSRLAWPSRTRPPRNPATRAQKRHRQGGSRPAATSPLRSPPSD